MEQSEIANDPFQGNHSDEVTPAINMNSIRSRPIIAGTAEDNVEEAMNCHQELTFCLPTIMMPSPQHPNSSDDQTCEIDDRAFSDSFGILESSSRTFSIDNSQPLQGKRFLEIVEEVRQ